MIRRLSALLVGAALIATTAPAAAQDPAATVRFPQFGAEIDLSLIGIGTTRASDPARRGASVFLFGELALGLALSETFSLQGVLATEPIGEGDTTGGFPQDGLIGFRRQALFVEQLYAQWQPREGLALQGGILVAPFGRGHHDFPGILTAIRAHEVYLVDQSLGVGATWTWLDDTRFGTHDISGAVFTLDRSFITSTLITSRRCCSERHERYRRNTAAQGGPGNTGRLNNFALALDGDKMPLLPGLSYHLALLSRGAGSDGTAREWGYAVALRYEQRWTRDHSTLLFAEAVQLRTAGGRPRVEIETEGLDPDTGEEITESAETTLAERLTFTTLGVQHRIGPWRGTLAWQHLRRKRSVAPLPVENWFEASVGRALGAGFSLDIGYQYARYAEEEGGARGTSHAVLGRLRYTGSL